MSYVTRRDCVVLYLQSELASVTRRGVRVAAGEHASTSLYIAFGRGHVPMVDTISEKMTLFVKLICTACIGTSRAGIASIVRRKNRNFRPE